MYEYLLFTATCNKHALLKQKDKGRDEPKVINYSTVIFVFVTVNQTKRYESDIRNDLK